MDGFGLTKDELARRLGTNTAYLSRGLNEGLGLGFAEAINGLRVHGNCVDNLLFETIFEFACGFLERLQSKAHNLACTVRRVAIEFLLRADQYKEAF